jgi:hypothetical protein
LQSIDVRAVSGETARKLQTLRTDFAALQTAYNEQLLNGPAGNTAPGAMNTAADKDWRLRYAAVQSDLRDLIGSEDLAAVTGGSAPATGAADLDPRMREQLQNFRTMLDTLSTSSGNPPPAPAPGQSPTTTPGQSATTTPGQPQAPVPPCTADQLSNDVPALLTHIEDVVTEALKSTDATDSARNGAHNNTTPVGTSGTMTVKGGTSNKVSIERDKLDEIRAEVQQLKVLLKK